MTALIVAFILKRQSTYSFERIIQEEALTKNKKQLEEEQNLNSEISIMIMCPWVCYLIADGLELSGIVAIMTNGIFLNYYATPNVTKGSK